MYYKAVIRIIVVSCILIQVGWATISIKLAFDRSSDEFSDVVAKIYQKLNQNISQNIAFMQSFEVLTSVQEEDAIYLVDRFAKTIMPQHPRIKQVVWLKVEAHNELERAVEIWSHPATVKDELKHAVIGYLLKEPWHGMRVFASNNLPNQYVMVDHSENARNHYVLVMVFDAITMLDIPAGEDIDVEWTIGTNVITNIKKQDTSLFSGGVVLRENKTPLTNNAFNDSPTKFPSLTNLIIEKKVGYIDMIDYRMIFTIPIIFNIFCLLLYYLIKQKRMAFLLAESEKLTRAEAKRLELENRLEHASRINTIGELTSGIVHELSQPLSSILSYSQAGLMLIKKEQATTELIEQAFSANTRDAKRAGQLLQKFREYLSDRKPTEQVTLLNDAIVDIASILSPELKRNGIDLILHLSQSSLFSSIDKIELEQVIHNLVGNSIEALSMSHQEIKRIDVSILGSDKKNIIKISDNGTGIDSHVLSELFQPFITSKANGMGLGLSICQRIVTRSGGTITGHNDGGAVFIVILPALESS